MEVVRIIISKTGQLFSLIAVFIIKLYQIFISPLLPRACRYYPTCSVYSIEAFKRHGPVKGCYLTLKRVLSCNPFFEGGFDPVPEKFNLWK
jgi:putative membrane protein insertion efficiency factor